MTIFWLLGTIVEPSAAFVPQSIFLRDWQDGFLHRWLETVFRAGSSKLTLAFFARLWVLNDVVAMKVVSGMLLQAEHSKCELAEARNSPPHSQNMMVVLPMKINKLL